ncbi:putative pentatricopeptide repeat-containing protein At1g17630 [Papaver somniferum]|nr:putative pentatricopeptide repeat-containing protein At1g17630 [Papaver somniferum]
MLNGSLGRIFLRSRFNPATLSLSHNHRQIQTENHDYNGNSLDLFAYLLEKCSTCKQTKEIHTKIIHSGENQSGFLFQRLISSYSELGFLDEANIVFHNIPNECKSDLSVWNSILTANKIHGFDEETIHLYIRMRNSGVSSDGFTFPLVIKACTSVGDSKLCKAIHGHVLVSGYQFNLHVGNDLIHGYGKMGLMDDAITVFDKMSHRNHVSWNTMFSGFAHNFDCDGAVKMFRLMERDGLEPHLLTWTSFISVHKRCGLHGRVIELFRDMRGKMNCSTGEVIAVVLSSCAELDKFQMAKEIHGYVISGGFQDYMFVQNSLISVYGKNGNVEEARNLFMEIKIKNLVSWNALISSFADAGFSDEAHKTFSQLVNIHDGKLRPNVVSFSAVIGGFAAKRKENECFAVFREMLHFKVHPNSVTIACLLSLCAEVVALDLGKEIHGYSVRALMDKNILVGNSLVNMYTKCGAVMDACSVFDHMDNRDLISWNSMIAGYGMHGLANEALATFREMVKLGSKPDVVTFVAVLSACSHAGLVTEGRKLFDQMSSEFMITPDMEHYSCIVDLLGRAGLLQEANELTDKMTFEPDECVWGALLNACRIHKNTEMAELIKSRLNLESEMTGTYMCLSNIYASHGRWEDSAKVRVAAKTRGLKKIPGQSRIEVKKKSYIFSSGNSFQSGLDKVYEILVDLCPRMEAEGYVPDKSFVLQDVGDEEKKEILNGHSEKLAIAFGHANIPPNFPIRVTKNLRVCGDCHNWTKIFTKVTEREVIVRDGRRFHHFKDGLCSCGDYW